MAEYGEYGDGGYTNYADGGGYDAGGGYGGGGFADQGSGGGYNGGGSQGKESPSKVSLYYFLFVQTLLLFVLKFQMPQHKLHEETHALGSPTHVRASAHA